MRRLGTADARYRGSAAPHGTAMAHQLMQAKAHGAASGCDRGLSRERNGAARLLCEALAVVTGDVVHSEVSCPLGDDGHMLGLSKPPVREHQRAKWTVTRMSDWASTGDSVSFSGCSRTGGLGRRRPPRFTSVNGLYGSGWPAIRRVSSRRCAMRRRDRTPRRGRPPRDWSAGSSRSGRSA